MPIPQLNKIKKGQGWKQNQKNNYSTKSKYKTTSHKKHSTQKNNKKQSNFNFKKNIFIFFSLLILISIVFISFTIFWLSRGLPNPNHLLERQIAQSTKIYDRTGKTILYEIHGDEKRTLINLKDIPNYVKDATIAIEDKDFYKHGGISVWGIFRGVVIRILSGKSPQGGSTLTQQFVKNAILTPERTITRKLKEWILSYRLEKVYSKDEILQMYFNEIPYGSTAYGVEAASRRYFGKSVKDVTLPEAAILASLPQAPTKYSPYGPNKNLLIGRQHYVLDLMAKQGYISKNQATIAKNTKLKFKKQSNNIIAPHFVMYIKELLTKKYGEKMIEQGGLKIYTTIDLYKQKIAEEIIKNRAKKNEKKYNASNTGLISLNPKTGEILAMVGSRDYFDENIDGQVNITTSKRQPGSSLKPLVYAAAFLKGYTPKTILYDVVTNFSNNPDEPYEPHNYDNKEHGPVSIRKALAGSLNIPAVKIIYLAGINNVLDLAQAFGYTTLNDRDRFGLSLVLGGGEVKLLEHTRAYCAFAREGILPALIPILKIEDSHGKIIENHKPENKKVLDPNIARMINDILSDNEARAYAFGEHNWLTLGGRPVAAKTGTTNDYRDAWTIGYTPSLVTGVWVGNNNNSPMKRGAAGGVVAAPIWHDFMKKVLGNTPKENFHKPDIPKTDKNILDGEIKTATVIKIDKASGLLATEYTPKNFIEERSYYQPHCILYYVNKNDPLGPKPKNPANDPQFNLWESRVQEWAKKQSATSTTLSTSSPPTEFDNLHIPINLPKLKIINPSKNQTITDPLLFVKIKTSASRGVTYVKYYINGNLLTTIKSFPFNLIKNINFLNNGFYDLNVKSCDDIDNCTTKNIEFNLRLSKKIKDKSINLSLLSPQNGLAVNNIDFPLKIKFKINNPNQVAKLNIYYLQDKKTNPQLIKSIKPTNNIISIFWNLIPSSGTYKIYGELNTWEKQTIQSNKSIIIIKNINKTK